MSIRYNLESDSAVQALLNKQRDLIQEQTTLIATQNSIITSLSCMMCDRAHIGMASKTVDYLEDKLTEV